MELERMLLPKTPNSAEESIPNQLGPLDPKPTYTLIDHKSNNHKQSEMLFAFIAGL